MTLDFVGLIGMLSQAIIESYANISFTHRHIWTFCFVRVVWRFFGMSSGCVAFIMAIERYFALTKPFFYCKHFTNGLIKRLILMMWTSCALLTFAPAFGFGIFCDVNAKKCERYRDADEPLDVAYAFICFFAGQLVFFVRAQCRLNWHNFPLSRRPAGIFLCMFMILCNYSVTRIVYRSYRNMQQLTMSCMNNSENFKHSQPPIKLRHQISGVSSSSSTTSKSISLITRDEIRFINMCNLLTASFVLCWAPQMVSLVGRKFATRWSLLNSHESHGFNKKVSNDVSHSHRKP